MDDGKMKIRLFLVLTAKICDVFVAGGEFSTVRDDRLLDLRREGFDHLVEGTGRCRANNAGEKRHQHVTKVFAGLSWQLGWKIVDCKEDDSWSFDSVLRPEICLDQSQTRRKEWQRKR